MAGRYLVTGTQLGILKACLLECKESKIGVDLIEDIVDKQFLCNSERTVIEDINFMQK